MPVVCELLGLHPDALPHPTTFYHSLDRYAMYVWQALLRASAQQLRQSWYVALDGTFFERKQASPYYLQRRERTVETIKATTLTDTASLAVVDVYCCIALVRKLDSTTTPDWYRGAFVDRLDVIAADRKAALRERSPIPYLEGDALCAYLYAAHPGTIRC